MSDPFFDLGSMSATEEFTDEEMLEILAFYLEAPPSAETSDGYNKCEYWLIYDFVPTVTCKPKSLLRELIFIEVLRKATSIESRSA